MSQDSNIITPKPRKSIWGTCFNADVNEAALIARVGSRNSNLFDSSSVTYDDNITPLSSPSPNMRHIHDQLSPTSGLGHLSSRNTSNYDPFDTEPQDTAIDLQSILIDEDIQMLKRAELIDTRPFVPNIKYGKVLHVFDPTRILIAARIYNGYTKVLQPVLYNFTIRLRDVKIVVHDEDRLKEKLKGKILGKIVVLCNISMNHYGEIDADVVCDKIHINKYILYDM